jgi:U3 small nucleolar RNA-associated protein 10
MLGCSDGEHSASPSTVLKRRAHALIIFVGLAMKPCKEGQSPISPLVAQLIALATVDTNSSDDILGAARSSLNGLLSTMPVIDFIASVQSALVSEDVKVLHFYFLPRIQLCS